MIMVVVKVEQLMTRILYWYGRVILQLPSLLFSSNRPVPIYYDDS